MSELQDQIAEQPRSRATLFGAPIGELDIFTSILFGGAVGFGAFFVTTFLGIMGILFYNSMTHAQVDFSYSYLRIGMPIGLVVALVAWAYLGRLWVARVFGSK